MFWLDARIGLLHHSTHTKDYFKLMPQAIFEPVTTKFQRFNTPALLRLGSRQETNITKVKFYRAMWTQNNEIIMRYGFEKKRGFQSEMFFRVRILVFINFYLRIWASGAYTMPTFHILRG